MNADCLKQLSLTYYREFKYSGSATILKNRFRVFLFEFRDITYIITYSVLFSHALMNSTHMNSSNGVKDKFHPCELL